MAAQLAFRYLLTPEGLQKDRAVTVDDAGIITAIGPSKGPYDGFLALPGMPDAHSHSFQRGLAGFGEAASGGDSFWSWREAMYRLARRLDAQDLYHIASQCFAEMLAGGFTSVAEFHYLHHLKGEGGGTEMAAAVQSAAADLGLPMRLLPVFYHAGGFGKPPLPEQQRFVHSSIDGYCRYLERLSGSLGIAPHSLRAVPPELLSQLLAQARSVVGDDVPVHIHISEQEREVVECRSLYGTQPVELLARSTELDARWNLVHATHASAAERGRIVASGARVVLCPITEAYLGDGLFVADEFRHAGGALAVGSDSNCRIDALEELRWMEYGQRLRARLRARLADSSGLGGTLWSHCARAGAAALGLAAGEVAQGRRADLITFDESCAALAGHDGPRLLDALLIGASRADIAAVYLGGVRVVESGNMDGDSERRAAFARVVRKILGGM